MKNQITKVDKPWGYELIFALTPQYAGKILHIKKGESLSFQYHEKKEETIYLYKGRMKLEVQEKTSPLKTIELKSGESFHITPNLKHRMIAQEDCDVFEVSTPELNDVVRLKDTYGRTPQ